MHQHALALPACGLFHFRLMEIPHPYLLFTFYAPYTWLYMHVFTSKYSETSALRQATLLGLILNLWWSKKWSEFWAGLNSGLVSRGGLNSGVVVRLFHCIGPWDLQFKPLTVKCQLPTICTMVGFRNFYVYDGPPDLQTFIFKSSVHGFHFFPPSEILH